VCVFSGKIHWQFTFIIWLMICVPNNIWLNPIPLLIGSLFPDTDCKSAPIGRFIPLWLIWNHRGFTHTLPALVLFSLPIGIWYSWKWSALFACGYLLHLAMDSSTPMGVKWIGGHKKRKKKSLSFR
jgi:membrane-bound metal-dependent hydrolase YbcI (DUF457 family)